MTEHLENPEEKLQRLEKELANTQQRLQVVEGQLCEVRSVMEKALHPPAREEYCNVQQIQGALALLLNAKGNVVSIGSRDRANIENLQRLFGLSGSVSLEDILSTLYKGRTQPDALNLFRGFKMRLNARMLALHLCMRLVHESESGKSLSQRCARFVRTDEQGESIVEIPQTL